MRRSRVFASAVPIAAAAFLLAACDATTPRGPGAIRIQASTTSAEPYHYFEYAVHVDGGAPYPVFSSPAKQFLVKGLAHGPHTVSVAQLPENCSAGSQGNDRNVTLVGDDTVNVSFFVVCGRTSGDLTIIVNTTGSSLDPDGYLLTVGSYLFTFVSVNAMQSIGQMPVGTYTIGLSGLADNCTYGGPQTVTVSAGSVITVTLNVTCAPLAYARVVATTTGDDRDEDGFLLDAGSAGKRRFARSGTTVLAMQSGSVQYTIRDVQPNCEVTSGATGTATFSAGDTVTISADVACVALPVSDLGTTLADPVADTLPGSGGFSPAHDVSNISARYAPGWLILTTRFRAPVTYASANASNSLYGFLELDVDENSATGTEALTNYFGGDAPIGVDFAVLLFDASLTSTPLLKVSYLDVLEVGRVPTRFAGDSMIVYLPLEKLDADDGNLAAAMVVGTQDRATDVVPNSGAFLARPASGATPLASAGAAIPRRPASGAAAPYATKAGKWRAPR